MRTGRLVPWIMRGPGAPVQHIMPVTVALLRRVSSSSFMLLCRPPGRLANVRPSSPDCGVRRDKHTIFRAIVAEKSICLSHQDRRRVYWLVSSQVEPTEPRTERFCRVRHDKHAIFCWYKSICLSPQEQRSAS